MFELQQLRVSIVKPGESAVQQMEGRVRIVFNECEQLHRIRRAALPHSGVDLHGQRALSRGAGKAEHHRVTKIFQLP